MSALMLERTQTPAKPKKVTTVLRVAVGEQYVGDILLNAQNRVWRHADTIPADVVLKVLLAFTRRGERLGQVISRRGAQTFNWIVMD